MVKLKLGFDGAGDVDFLKRAAQACPHESRLMIDSNQKWDLEHVQRMLDRLAPSNLLFAEEPIPANAAPRGWERLAKSSTVPLAASENIYGIKNYLMMAEAGVQYLQPDVAKWGGLFFPNHRA